MPSAEYQRDYRQRRADEDRAIPTRKDKRKRRPTHKGGKLLSKWDRRLIVAWDGEGVTREDGSHIYNLLSNSDRVWIDEDKGLGTERIFEFLLSQSNQRAINVIYGGSYDVNMWLRDVPIEKLLMLWQEGKCYWRQYKITYAHRKKFSLSEVRQDGGKARNIVIWDVLGYFQTTFVDACTKWLGELPILDSIQEMKYQRSSFQVEDFAKVLEYNHMECSLLVDLMTSLFSAMDEAGIRLTRYDGAGSIAAYLLKTSSIKEHMGDNPLEIQRWAQRAYSGGRIEPPKIGNASGPIYRYDVNSAYPSACLELPSWKDATWHLESFWNESDFSLVHIEFNFPHDRPFYPLWYREENGTILYPHFGEGVYWGVEVAAMAHYFEEGIHYTIKEAYNCYLPRGYIRPFGFIKNTYEQRLKFKARGSMASEALKLGMNSIYGKLAQQAGYRGGRKPSYHNLEWAGLITAMNRAKLYRAAMQNPSAVIAFATDAIITTEPFDDLIIGTNLGLWTADTFDGITIVQAGVYWLKDEGSWREKYRGFDKGSLQRDDIIHEWERTQQLSDYPIGYTQWYCKVEGCDDINVHIHSQLTRFIGMGGAFNRKHFYDHWTRWETMDRKLGIEPTGKRRAGPDTCYDRQLCSTIAVEPRDPFKMSAPYKIIWLDGESMERPTEDGLDVRVIEEEELDSYA